jgi:hypothetical protein
MEDYVNRQELGSSFQWEALAGGSTPFLHRSDAAFDLWDAAGQVEHGATEQGLDQGF